MCGGGKRKDQGQNVVFIIKAKRRFSTNKRPELRRGGTRFLRIGAAAVHIASLTMEDSWGYYTHGMGGGGFKELLITVHLPGEQCVNRLVVHSN